MAIKIYLSPSDQTANKYASGNTNEAVQCRKIADACAVALKRCGFEVKNNKTSSMAARVAESDKWGADLHVPIHTNAFNGKTSGTRLFCWDTKGDGYKACKAIFNALAPLTPGTSENIRADTSLYEIRNPSAPTAYIEVDFHDVADVAKWIIVNVEEIGEAIAKGICSYFGKKYVEPEPPEPPKTYKLVLGEYATEAEAEAALKAVHKLLGEAQVAMSQLDAQLRKAEIE